jgi:diphosphomevalonate decarboxylase
MKATAKAPSNIAFIKYWGRTDEVLRLPSHGSISMNLSNLFTTTTVEFSQKYEVDEVVIDKRIQIENTTRVTKHLDRIRALAHTTMRAKVVSVNSFPSGTGLSSSASGFAALTLAATSALSLALSTRELSILARQGSGSSARSIPDGFVEWKEGETSEASYAYTLYPAHHWKLCDIVAVVSEEKKETPTSEGQKNAASSPFYAQRLQHIGEKLTQIKHAIETKDFELLGEISEREALELHAIMLTSWPPLIYWTERTVKLMKQVQKWRTEGIPVYFTINTGQDVHLLCEEQIAGKLQILVKALPYVKKTIVNYPSVGANVINEHLF